jgi:ABC-type oligopeptide transport system ATPase subunit
MSAAALVEARNLVKHFGGERQIPFGRTPVIRAVDGVSFSIRLGETFAIVGESGCGKSTLARLLLCLIPPTRGTVIFDGKDLTAASPETLRRLRRDMQIIFQDPFSSLNPRMTVGELVAEPLKVHDLASGSELLDRVAATLRKVGLLPEHARRYPHEFSGGQRQRIGIARALASGPRLVIGDEPVSALDVSIRAQIVNLLEDLKAELGLTLALVAHDLALIRHTSDRIAVMYLGEIVELAEREALFEAPRHPYTRSLLAAIPLPIPGARAPRFCRGRSAKSGRTASRLSLPYPLRACGTGVPRRTAAAARRRPWSFRCLPSGGSPAGVQFRAGSSASGWRAPAAAGALHGRASGEVTCPSLTKEKPHAET